LGTRSLGFFAINQKLWSRYHSGNVLPQHLKRAANKRIELQRLCQTIIFMLNSLVVEELCERRSDPIWHYFQDESVVSH
jgi:hypothetical protein